MSLQSVFDAFRCLLIQLRSRALVHDHVLFHTSLAPLSSIGDIAAMRGGITIATRPASVFVIFLTSSSSMCASTQDALLIPPTVSRKDCTSSSIACALASLLPKLAYESTSKYSTRAPWKNSRYQPSSFATKAFPLLGSPLMQITCLWPRTPKNCF